VRGDMSNQGSNLCQGRVTGFFDDVLPFLHRPRKIAAWLRPNRATREKISSEQTAGSCY
jgi:hypothetical protein